MIAIDEVTLVIQISGRSDFGNFEQSGSTLNFYLSVGRYCSTT